MPASEKSEPSALRYWLLALFWISCILGFMGSYLAAFELSSPLAAQLGLFALPWVIICSGVLISAQLIPER